MLAFAISRRVGKAVVRNRVRRRLREAARDYPGLPSGIYLIRTKAPAATLGYVELRDHLFRAVAQLDPSGRKPPLPGRSSRPPGATSL